MSISMTRILVLGRASMQQLFDIKFTSTSSETFIINNFIVHEL